MHSEIEYIRSNDNNFNFIHDLFYARENAFKKQIPDIKEELTTYARESGTKKLVYSEESLTSFSMFFRFNPAPYIYTLDPNSVARKLGTAFISSQVFKKTKII